MFIYNKTTANTGLAKVAVQWLNHPESFRDCASIQVQCRLPVKRNRNRIRLPRQSRNRCRVVALPAIHLYFGSQVHVIMIK
jgi:hypothetical protein